MRLEAPDLRRRAATRRKRVWSAGPRTSCSPRTWTDQGIADDRLGAALRRAARRGDRLMRPVRLVAEGFSAFRDPIDVDFDGADFFALVGPTGSGKSSILDAICFALYGSVPRYGDDRARRARHHAGLDRGARQPHVRDRRRGVRRDPCRAPDRRAAGLDEGSAPRARHRGARRRRARDERRRSPSSSACRSTTSPAASCSRRASSPSSCTTSRRTAKT